MTSNVVLCAPVRTPIGAYGGTLKDMTAPALGSIAIAETITSHQMCQTMAKPSTKAKPPRITPAGVFEGMRIGA